MFKFVALLPLLILPFTQVAQASQITTSPNDARQYQSLTLANQLQVLLISDPLTDKAAVSLDIDVGSASNPENRLGLAHFLEHMLFLGTKKYPIASEYQDFIQSHGGSHNAFTSQDNTNYYFDIAEDSLAPALDRFSQFFIAPLFAEKYTDRERNAVHSEYQSKLKDDGRRNFAAFKKIMNPAHPGSRFSVGSIETLSDNNESKIRDDLLNFYQRYYSANRMTLVVLGKSSLQELKALVEDKFSTIENRNVAKPVIDVSRFAKEKLPLLLKVKSIKDFRQLTLSFPMPAAQHLWRTKPLYFISSLVGYEGDGSLLALLKEKGYANGLSAASSNDSKTESSFQVSISLTPLGLDNIDRVTEYFFDFISQLQKQGVSQRIYQEEKRLSAQAFQFLPRQAPSSYVVWLSQVMREYPLENWLNAGFMLEDYKPAQIADFIAEITPDNMLMNIQAQSLEGDKTELNYGTQYSVSAIDEQRLINWRAPRHDEKLAVRAANPYIAEDLSILAQTEKQDTPLKIELDKGVTLWHQQDSEFKTPKADLFFTLLMPDRELSTQQRVSLALYSRLLNDKLNKIFYDAASAGISVSLYAHSRGLSVRISGYNDKQWRIIEQFDQIASMKFDRERFEILKENYRKSLANSLKDKPYNQLLGELYQILGNLPDAAQKLTALEEVNLDDIYQLAAQYFSDGELRILSHGNLNKGQAEDLALKIKAALGVKQTKKVTREDHFLALMPGTDLILNHNIDNNNSALVLYLQAASNSETTRAATAVLAEILSSDYYSQLRTEQQLGYIVFASSMSIRRHPGLVFAVQSPKASPTKIASSNSQFLSGFTRTLATLNTEKLDVYKRSVVGRISEKERTITQRSGRLWSEIDLSNGDFGDREALIQATNNLTIEVLQQAWQQMLLRRIQLQSNANHLNTPPSTSENQAVYQEIKQLRKKP